MKCTCQLLKCMVAVCRFWAALILNDLIQEMPVSDVATKYGLPRGQLQGLQDRAGEQCANLKAVHGGCAVPSAMPP